MSYALILFDYDGCTSVVPSSRLGLSVKISEKHTLKYSGQDHLVEVLDVSDSKQKLNNFEKEWTESHRSKALDKQKRLRNNREGTKFGGFLAVWPEEDENSDRIEEQPTNKTRKEAVVKLKRTDAPVGIKKIQNPPVLTGIRKRKAVSALQSAKKQAKESNPSAKTARKELTRPETVTRNLSKTASVAKKTRTKQTVPRTKAGPRKQTNTLRLAKTTVDKDTAPKETTAASGSKTGSNGRSINVLFEGASEGSTSVALPGRQPLFTDHLTADQTELLSSRLSEYSCGKRSVGVQTDSVIMFSNTEELRKAGQVPTRETGINTDTIDNFNHDLRMKMDQIISILTNDINKKLEDLLSPQSISFLPMSTPLHSSTTMTSKKNTKNDAVKTLLLPDVPLGQPASEDELTGLTDLNLRTVEKTNVESCPVTDSFPSSGLIPVVSTASGQSGVACHSVAVTKPADSICFPTQVQSSVAAVTDYDLAPLDLSSSFLSHSSVGNPISNSTPASVVNGVDCFTSDKVQNSVAWFPNGVTSSSLMHSSVCAAPLGVTSSAGQNRKNTVPDGISLNSSSSHQKSTTAVLGAVSISPSTLACNSNSDVPGIVSSPTTPPFTAYPLGASSSALVSLGTRPQMLVETQICNVPVGTKSHELSQSCVSSQSADASIPAFSQINESSNSVDIKSTVNQICLPSASVVASSNVATPTDVCQNAMGSFQITESCDLGQSDVTGSSYPVPVGSSYLGALGQNGISSNSCVENSLRPSGHVEAHARQPLSSISHGQLNRGQNFAEIRSFEDMKHVASSSKVRIARDHARYKKATSAHAGNFAWHLTQDVYSANELEGRNFNGNYGKQGLSPRRKEAIEEAVHDMYGADQKHIKAASKAINSGLRGKIFRASSKSTIQNTAVSSWPAGVNLASLMQVANIPTLQIQPVQSH